MSRRSRRESGFYFRCEKKSRDDLHFKKLPCSLWLKNGLLEVWREADGEGCTRNETKPSSLKCSGFGMWGHSVDS